MTDQPPESQPQQSPDARSGSSLLDARSSARLLDARSVEPGEIIEPEILVFSAPAVPSAQDVDALYLRNRDYTRKLEATDGVVAAVVEIKGEKQLVTTHADYVPAPPDSFHHDVRLRKDFRYGLDDATLWPQQFSQRYCHLGAIRRKEGCQQFAPRFEHLGAVRIRTKEGTHNEYYMMYWDPSPADFIVHSGPTPTAALGKLESQRFDSLSRLVKHKDSSTHLKSILFDYNNYVEKTPRDKVPAPLPQTAVSMCLALERLTLPSSYDGMILSVRKLQRTCLEVDAMLQYMTSFKPRIDDPNSVVPDQPTEYLMGVYTGNPEVAVQLHIAGIPYWYIRPASEFSSENILAIVSPRPPLDVEVCLHEKYTEVIDRIGQNTDQKIEAISKVSRVYDWYRNPFEEEDTSTSPPIASSSRPSIGADRSRSSRNNYRPAPWTVTDIVADNVSSSRGAARAPLKPPPGRNKFEPIPDRPEMPPTIPAWERALRAVDHTRKPSHQPRKIDSSYVLPEPALLTAPEQPVMRQLRLHHYQLLHDALQYRIANKRGDTLLMTSQEWRDILNGKVVQEGPQNSKARERTGTIQRLLTPALQACGVKEFGGFPAHIHQIPTIPNNRAHEIIWEVAETNFRFELMALDRRASGLDRRDECRACFAGGMLVCIPIELGKQGMAAMALTDRHPFNIRLARLMCGWGDAPGAIRNVDRETTWIAEKMSALEDTVIGFYCQQFYEYFGRAAVIPMRLEHETGDARLGWAS
ncbi:hypothetical protein B0H14DRAFT_2609644 [Mycena olivaceomarginata]|nr:hypothetical protein B0H14DRAFT_2609644 [Mycena olivaceomarginata]